MKKLLLFGIAVWAMISFCACHKHHSVLNNAELLVEGSPEAVLTLLKSIDNPGELSASDFARYALLQVQAMDKCDKDITQDSLLTGALNYYRTSADSLRAGKAYFYAARVAQDSYNPTLALEYYLRAKDLLQHRADALKYKFLACYYLSDVYDSQWMSEEQLAAAFEALEHARAMGSKDNEAFALHKAGVAYARMHLNDSANVCLRRAADCGMPGLQSSIYRLLWIVACWENDGAGMQMYGDSLKAYATDSDKEQLNKVEGVRHLKEHRYDSAVHYLQKNMYSSSAVTLASSMIDLSRAYEGMGHTDSALHYLREFSKRADSIRAQKRVEDVWETKIAFRQNRLMEENMILRQQNLEKSKREMMWMIVVFIGVLVSLTAGGGFYLWKKRVEYEKELVIAKQKRENKGLNDKLLRLRSSSFLLVNKKMLPQLEGDASPLSESDWGTVYENIDTLFDGFTKRLRIEFPTITETEIRLCCLVKMNINNDMTANIMCITPAAAYKKKLRMAKHRMGFFGTKELEDYLEDF